MFAARRVQLGRVFVLIGLVLAACFAAALVEGALQQRLLSRRLEAVVLEEPPPASFVRAVETRREAQASGLVGALEIPSIALSVVVVEGDDSRALRRGVGHLPGTAFPGESGNVGLAGHRDTHFGALRDIAPGDTVTLRTPDGTFSYCVDSVLIVGPERVDLIADAGMPMLTLVTCYPFHWVGPAPRRFVVRAPRVDADTTPEGASSSAS